MHGLYIVVGLPGAGKTSFIAAKCRNEMFNHDRYDMTCNAIAVKQAGGFPYSAPEEHCVYTNFDLYSQKWRYNPRENWYVDPSKIGLGRTELCFIPPYACIGITEAHEHYDCRGSKDLPSYVYRFFERYRHNGYLIYMDAQAADSIDRRIRRLAQIIEIQRKEDKPTGHVWYYRFFENYEAYESYVKSGKTEKSYTEETFEVDFDVHACYNSHGCEPDFGEGHTRHDYDRSRVIAPEPTPEAYEEYYEKRRKK